MGEAKRRAKEIETAKVSVVIPCFNMAKWLSAAVESVMAQTCKPDEVIIYDDGSTDGSKGVAEELAAAHPDANIVVTGSEENKGAGEAYKKLLAMAKGNFILPFAADDILQPTFVEKALAEFAAHKDAMMVSCHPSFMDEFGNDYSNSADMRLMIAKPVNHATKEEFKESLRRGNQYFGALMYRTSIFNRIGGFDNDLKWLQDWDFYLRVLNVGNIRVIEEPLIKLRFHGQALSNITTDKIPEQARLFRVIRERHFAPAKRKVILASAHYLNLCFSNYKTCFSMTTDWLTRKGIDWEILDVNGDSYVDRAKNTLASKFLETDGSELLMIDNDMTWHPSAVERILSWSQEIVAGAFPMKNNWGMFVGDPQFQPDGNIRGFPLSDGSFLMEARRVAGGFLRIKRSALLKFADAYPERVYVDPSADPECRNRIYIDFFECARKRYTRYGEDMYFSELCKEAGIELFIDPNITFGHFGINRWEGNYHEHLMRESKKNEALIAEQNRVEQEAKVIEIRDKMEENRKLAAAEGVENGGAPTAVQEMPLAAGVSS